MMKRCLASASHEQWAFHVWARFTWFLSAIHQVQQPWSCVDEYSEVHSCKIITCFLWQSLHLVVHFWCTVSYLTAQMYISRCGFLIFQTPASILWSMTPCMLLVPCPCSLITKDMIRGPFVALPDGTCGLFLFLFLWRDRSEVTMTKVGSDCF